MKITIWHIIGVVGLLAIFCGAFYFIGHSQGKLTSDEKKINQELVQVRKEKEMYKLQRDSVDALLRFTFDKNIKQHKADSLKYENYVNKTTSEFEAALKKLRHDKTNRNFRDLGLDSTMHVLTGFIPNKNH